MHRHELRQTGSEPEFFACCVAFHEPVGGDIVRLYVASRRNGVLRLEYTLLATKSGLIHMAKQALRIADDPAFIPAPEGLAMH